MTPRQQVLAKFPTAKVLKINIASWGVAITGTKRWLSYGCAMPYLAWREAANAIPSTRANKA